MRTWIKLYTEILHDPKMHALTDKQFRACINLFALAGYIDKEGEIGTIEDAKFHLRLNLRDAQTIAKHLESVGVLQFDGSKYTVTAFYKRNGTSPSQSNDRVLQRVKSYRSRKQGESESGNETVTPLHSDRNESVTPLDKNRIEENIEDSADKPRKAVKPKAERAPDELFDAIAKVTCTDPATAGASIGKIKSALVKADPPYSAYEVLKFGEDWPAWKDKPPTLWQLKEQIGIVRNGNGNGHHGDNAESIKGYTVYR